MIIIINNDNRNELFLIEMKFFWSENFFYAKWFFFLSKLSGFLKSKGTVTGAWLKK